MKETHIDLDLELPDDLSLTEAHKRSEDLEDALRRELPDLLRVAAHLEPRNDGSRRAARLSAAEEVRETLSKLPQLCPSSRCSRDGRGFGINLEREFFRRNVASRSPWSHG